MALGRRRVEQQADVWVPTASLPVSPGHPFYEQLNQVLAAAGFDRFCEERCRKFYHARLGRPSVPPGVYFRMLLVGYFEKLPSALHRKRAELVERSFEHVLDDGGMRRVYLRGRENIAKRYLIHTAAFNLGLIMRKLTGFGTPKGWADARAAAARRLRALWRALAAGFRRGVSILVASCRLLFAGDDRRVAA